MYVANSLDDTVSVINFCWFWPLLLQYQSDAIPS
jgi:hypothetical protein